MGHERVLDKTGYLKAPKACEFSEDGKWIYLKARGETLKYPRPDNLVTLGKPKFEKGESVCVAYNTVSPIQQVNALVKLMRAHESKGTRYYEKETILESDCYAYNDGVIKYTEDDNGYIHVTIGDTEYQYCPEAMYYYPDGATVSKFDRICSGVVSMQHVVNQVHDLNDVYLIFRKQLYTITDKEFFKTGISKLDGTPEEFIELLFAGLTSTTYDPNTNELEDIAYNGTQNAIIKGKSFYTAVSYGYSSKIIDRAIKGGVDLSGDVMTEVVLGLLMNDTLDKK